jgi:hypothetical protein
VFHFISFGIGIIAILTGIYRGATLIMLAILKSPVAANSISGSFAEYDVISSLSLGLIVTAVYVFWLRNATVKHPAEKASIFLTGLAIAAALAGVAFWYGCGLVLLNILEFINPSKTALTAENWATAIAFIVSGIAYIPLGLLLRQRSTQLASFAPQRGFTFTLLGGGILAAAIGGATALYAYGTAALNSPLDNWLYIAHAGIAAFAVGAMIVGIYLWTSIHSGFFSSARQPVETVTPPAETTAAVEEAHAATSVTAQQEVTAPLATQEPQVSQVAQAMTAVAVTPSIGEIVDELLAGKISRDEAVARIEKMGK